MLYKYTYQIYLPEINMTFPSYVLVFLEVYIPSDWNFRKLLINKILNDVCRSHEEMSLKMIDYIVDEHNIDIDSEILKKVKVWLLSV